MKAIACSGIDRKKLFGTRAWFQDVDDVFRKYDPQGTGKLDVHNFVKRLVSPAADNVNWFRDKDTYEFHVLNRAPMKKASAHACIPRMHGVCANGAR